MLGTTVSTVNAAVTPSTLRKPGSENSRGSWPCRRTPPGRPMMSVPWNDRITERTRGQKMNTAKTASAGSRKSSARPELRRRRGRRALLAVAGAVSTVVRVAVTTPRPSTTRTPGSSASRAPGRRSLLLRRPAPITTSGWASAAASTRTGQSPGSPTGVIAPYSMPVRSTAVSMGRKLALRTSSRPRTVVLTSARVVASTTQAATRSSPARLPPTTTQLAHDSSGMPVAADQGGGVGDRGVDREHLT